MAIKLGIVMDPISDINIKKDTSFAMLLEAQQRGYEIYYLEMQDLYIETGRAYGNVTALTVNNNPDNWYTFGEQYDWPLAELDVILMRKDPPFDTEYIYATYMLEQAEREGTLIVNKPQSLRDANEKLYTAWFPECCPTTLVSRDAKRIREFYNQHQDVILKPLDGMGGASIFRLKPDDANVGVILETLTEHGTRYAMAQTFIPEIKDGDKRILMINGEPIDYCLARIPAKGETRGNLAAGGRGEARPLSDSDRWIAEQVGPTLKEKGLIFVGLDVIGDKLTEINVTSPTCVQEISKAYDVDITGKLFDCIEEKLQGR
ncbi:glutathione synthase [Saccharobesus litoralis]|uniref:Glutathione synthetase n=1 Tax=Saccharobesus litoralis TaxID=2172099 RepID=A0A2S0VSW1_9ALTE|nr:glutathione synthase [Saccharobesus litoralis]AWB67301.1 glutathione synthase [Saccharobesus litoralis]